jgi:phosphoribosylglycinamide formyltransferase-1
VIYNASGRDSGAARHSNRKSKGLTVNTYRRGFDPRTASEGGADPRTRSARGSDPGSRRVGVLISGRGSNLQALIDATTDGSLNAAIAIVISNKADAAGLERARAAGIETLVLDHRSYASRADYDSAIARELRARQVSLVCLAGFMRLIGPKLLEEFPQSILNIHPSLLPAFPGVDAQRQALAHGVKISGATVHIVTGELDGGPIVLQSAVPVRDDDTVDLLSARILIEEHRLYPEAVRAVLNGGWRIEGRRFIRAPD